MLKQSGAVDEQQQRYGDMKEMRKTQHDVVALAPEMQDILSLGTSAHAPNPNHKI